MRPVDPLIALDLKTAGNSKRQSCETGLTRRLSVSGDSAGGRTQARTLRGCMPSENTPLTPEVLEVEVGTQRAALRLIARRQPP